MSKESYIEVVVREVERLKRLADGAISQTSEEGFFTAFESGSSIAIIVKHMSGNMHSRWKDFLTSDGEKSFRNRDAEFELTSEDTRLHLLARWESGWDIFINTLASLRPGDLDRTVTIRNEPLSVLQAINRQLTHYAYHVGQIVVLAKQQSGENWQTLSVAKGKSVDFNKNPDSYL